MKKSRMNLDSVNTVIDRFQYSTITGRALRIGILCCIAKESRFVPRAETGYKKTSNTRIRKIFGKHLGRYRNDDKLLNALKAKPEAFFNQVYGGRGGNGFNDGFKYRGRGFNQLTFKNNYRRFSYDGVNLVINPDLLNQIDVAANEPPRILRRLHNLREWSHGKENQIFQRSA